jgi:hypothetical protein
MPRTRRPPVDRRGPAGEHHGHQHTLVCAIWPKTSLGGISMPETGTTNSVEPPP